MVGRSILFYVGVILVLITITALLGKYSASPMSVPRWVSSYLLHETGSCSDLSCKV